MPTIVRTELSAGFAQTRLSSQVEPEDVANAIVDALEKQRFEVWVPRYLGVLDKHDPAVAARVRRVAAPASPDPTR